MFDPYRFARHVKTRTPGGEALLRQQRFKGRGPFWDHEPVEVEVEVQGEDEEGHVHYKLSHGFLLARSFDAFLTRIAMDAG